MECSRFVVISMLIVNWKLVAAKQFTCQKTLVYSSCTITDVVAQDNAIQLYPSSGVTISNLTILNSTMDEIPPISSRYSLNLNYLNCVGCGLTDITKHTFTPLSNLLELNISHGSYTKLQKNLFTQLTSLNQLNVSHGAISEIDDTAFYNLKYLEKLDLSWNNISRITANLFASLESLWYLDLQYNQIKVLGENLFINNSKLNYLNLEHNKIDKIDGRLFDPQHIPWTVTLAYNELTTVDTENMNRLWVQHNKIKSIFISRNIQFLNARHNDIENVTCEEESNQISTLDLSNNSLTELGCVRSLNQLANLYLSYNNIGKLNQSSFAALTKLKTLKLQSANIGKLEYGIFSHQNQLETLDISYNRMGNIALEILLAARGLKFLYLDGNNITEFSYNDLKTAFIGFQTIGIGDNDFNCTFLAQAIKHLNSNDIAAIVTSGKKVTDSHNINGIGCHDQKEMSTPAWIPNVAGDNTTTDTVNYKINLTLEAIIQQVEKLSQMKEDNDKIFKKLSEDIGEVKQQIFKMNSDILTNKAEILKMELSKNNISSSSSNNMWTQINQLNNITLEKQQISNRAQAQEMNELKFEVEKIGHKMSDLSSKLEKMMKEIAILQSSSGDASRSNSNSDNDLIRNVNIILITLIVAFCIYKGYKFVRNDLPRIRRYNTANTLHTNIEMNQGSAK